MNEIDDMIEVIRGQIDLTAPDGHRGRGMEITRFDEAHEALTTIREEMESLKVGFEEELECCQQRGTRIQQLEKALDERLVEYVAALTNVETFRDANNELRREVGRLRTPAAWTPEERKLFLFEATKASYAEGTRAGCEELAIHAAEMDTHIQQLEEEVRNLSELAAGYKTEYLTRIQELEEMNQSRAQLLVEEGGRRHPGCKLGRRGRHIGVHLSGGPAGGGLMVYRVAQLTFEDGTMSGPELAGWRIIEVLSSHLATRNPDKWYMSVLLEGE